jgi:8-oxo-dGTP diphosphatase
LVPGAGALAFDHAAIPADGIERARGKLGVHDPGRRALTGPNDRHPAPADLPAVRGVESDPRNFNRKVTSTLGFLLPADRRTSSGRGRPAQLFTRGPAAARYPPMLLDSPS